MGNMTAKVKGKDQKASVKDQDLFWHQHQPELYVGHSGPNAPVVETITWYPTWVIKLSAWKGTYDNMPMIKCIRIEIEDDHNPILIFGNHKSLPSGPPSDEITFAPGEVIHSLVMWGNGNGTRLGRIKLYTNNNQHFDTGACKGKTGFAASCGSGVWGGLKVSEGADVDGLEFMFVDLPTSN